MPKTALTLNSAKAGHGLEITWTCASSLNYVVNIWFIFFLFFAGARIDSISEDAGTSLPAGSTEALLFFFFHAGHAPLSRTCRRGNFCSWSVQERLRYTYDLMLHMVQHPTGHTVADILPSRAMRGIY